MTDTPNRLLAATRGCIREKGLAATTAREITGAAGANLAAITYHFGSKDRLVSEALLGELRAWLAPALEVLAADTEPATRTLTAIETLIATFEQLRDEAPVYLEALVQAPRFSSLHGGVVDLWAELRRSLAEQIAGMRDNGTLPAWIEPDAMAGLFVAVANGLVLHVTIDPDGPDLRAMAGQFGGLLLAARD
jgi:AcrR family transcriptional regulator